MLWLYDSRDRIHSERKLHILPLTSEGKRKAWDIVLDIEVPNGRKDYQDLVNIDAESPDIQNCGLFNDYWAEYGWYLMPVEEEEEEDEEEDEEDEEDDNEDEYANRIDYEYEKWRDRD